MADLSFGRLKPIARGTRYVPPVVEARGRLAAFDPIEVRLLDLAVAALALVILLPVMVFVAVAVFLTDPGPVLFSQTRIGRHGKPFRCYKFRTMVIDAEARLSQVLASDSAARAEWSRDHKLRNDPRITSIGSLLRKSSLDELPQLWNVLVGDMSLVGPRPIVPNEVGRYGRYIVHYHAVRPGITGLWQINGRNDVCYRRRVAYDVLYARKCKAQDNIRILLMTMPSILTRRGSY